MIVIVMGVVGAGKTTVGELLARRLAWQFADADNFHPQANVEKIRRGIPLSDVNRRPWLEQLRAFLEDCTARQCSLVLACSALKRSYREVLEVSPDVKFVYLKGSPDLIAERLRARHGHFADEQILASQLADLEEPEYATVVDIALPAETMVDQIQKALGLH
jgi:gluconokinase